MKSLIILATLAATGLGALALSPGTQTGRKKDNHEVVIVDSTMTLIESKSLHPDGSLERKIRGGASRRERTEGMTGTGNGGWVISSSWDPKHDLNLNREELPNAETYYKFTLLPHEQLKLNLDCERAGMITMMFLTPPYPEAAMAAQFKKGNLSSRPTRNCRASIQNVTNRPYVVYVLLQGQANYAFKLGIERSGGLIPPGSEAKPDGSSASEQGNLPSHNWGHRPLLGGLSRA